MKTFAGMVLEKTEQPVRLIEGVQIPPLNRGQVLVELAYSGACHSQVMEVDGQRGEDKFLPHFLGHEATGVVREVGSDVRKVQVGDRVILGWIKGEGIEAGGSKFNSPIGVVNSGGVSTFSQWTVASENRLVRLPKSIPMDEGVLFGCAIPTGAGIVLNQVRPADGSSIAVWGLGGVGMSALMATQAFKCKTVIAIDVEPQKLELAKEFGATHVINSAQEKVETRVAEIVGAAGLDYCVEAAGLTETIERAFGLVRRGGGRCVFASHPSQGQRIRIDPYELICGKKIEGSWGGASHPDRDIVEFERLYLAGKLPLKKLISKTYELHQVNEALEDIRQRRVNRPLIRINPNLK